MRAVSLRMPREAPATIRISRGTRGLLSHRSATAEGRDGAYRSGPRLNIWTAGAGAAAFSCSVWY